MKLALMTAILILAAYCGSLTVPKDEPELPSPAVLTPDLGTMWLIPATDCNADMDNSRAGQIVSQRCPERI